MSVILIATQVTGEPAKGYIKEYLAAHPQAGLWDVCHSSANIFEGHNGISTLKNAGTR